ncbi:hypothetical protein EAO71_35260 [Streptomyces sp. ms191]|uniref:hypothetical protein n=1 Tax=Streptomyces sp. ms191 TaxID=1827978 RepID=UPI0011CDB481|nr:hypothetical protein [Streptomyces sp. ms191]TXS16043.1 hypothetical protein EAO71_35260 [Streptomyces sp. ms191]
MNPDQILVSALARAALAEDHATLAQLINDCPDTKVRDAAAHTLVMLVAGFRAAFTPADWKAFREEAVTSLTLLELDPT